jgi:hypothetical protein
MTPAPNGVLATTPSMDTFKAQIEIVGQCFEGDHAQYGDPREYARIDYRISWQGSEPVDRVYGDLGDGDDEMGQLGHHEMSGTYDVTMTARVRTLYELHFRFYEVADPRIPIIEESSRLIAELPQDTFLVDPRNPCR